MANTSAATGLTVEQWDDKFFVEYIQTMPFKGMMGTGTSSVFQTKENLMKKQGDKVNFALINKLTGAGVTGSSTLEGNEEAMISRSFGITVDKLRNAVLVPEMEEQKSAISLRNASRDSLMTWAQEESRDKIIAALGSINGIAYGTASEAQKDAWLVDNADRVLFGAAKANNASNDHSAALLNIDATNDKLDTDAVSLLKRIALSANPKIRPVTLDSSGRRGYVAFCHPLLFRDLKQSSAMQQAQREVSLVTENNRLFNGGDLFWDNIIIKEIDDMITLAGVGNAGIDVGRFSLMGAQAIGTAWAKRWKTVTETFDYGDKDGVAVEAIFETSKLTFGSGSADTDDQKDHGVATGYFAAVADG